MRQYRVLKTYSLGIKNIHALRFEKYQIKIILSYSIVCAGALQIIGEVHNIKRMGREYTKTQFLCIL